MTFAEWPQLLEYKIAVFGICSDIDPDTVCHALVVRGMGYHARGVAFERFPWFHAVCARTGVWAIVSHPNKMAGKKEIRDLSDSELLSELKSLGLKIGPISPTTRRVYEKRLSKARGCDVVDSTCENQDSRASVGEDACTKLANSITDCTNRTSGLLESPAVFYGVCFDVARSSSESGLPCVPVVFTSKDEALKAAKKFKGARFKGFKTRVEAESFSRSRSTEQENSPAVTSTLYSLTDPVSNFKGPTPQELVKFRKVIENGSREEFLEIALKNPRYLTGPGDTPVVLQEGCRYNALHVAVKHNRKEMCQLIVDTLESQLFWNILLNQDTQSALNSQRRQFLVDMYLNTPDKGVSCLKRLALDLINRSTSLNKQFSDMA